MASPPFNPAETVPGDTDVAANYPAAERTFRDVMESWMLVEHDRYGHTTIGVGTEAERDADPNWSTGSMWVNLDTEKLEVVIDDSPSIVWSPVQGEFDPGTRVLLQQTAAPSGYTKEVGATFNDYVLRLVTGTVSTGGSVDFSTFLARTTTDGHALTSAENGPHTHTGGITGIQTAQIDEPDFSFPTGTSGTSTGSSGSGTAHTHPIDCRLKYRDVCIFVKD